MAAYFNVTFMPIWVIVLIWFIIEKYSNFGNLVQVIIVTVTTTIVTVEATRLYLIYEGNLKDKIPELAGFWMLSVFLQLPLQGLLLLNPYFQLGVLETICQAVMFILLILQIIFGYVALKFTASQQARFFKGKHESLKMRVLERRGNVNEGQADKET
ncbi:transmembrane protein 17-like isoform X2 [Anthonomus grandis grandis]|nr:transmembrane protein 17-like isoform X2 [Anthonomus grandis grandis]XP_050305262.1 transmembrane protein 17-like isoform X2 [Anthonomus grandis grandis]